MKKILIILLAMFMTAGCSSASKDAAKSSDDINEVAVNNDVINDEGADEKKNAETEISDQGDEINAVSSKKDNNSKNEKNAATEQETSKHSTTKKDSSQKKEAVADTGKSSTASSGNSSKETSTQPTESQKPVEPSQPPVSSDTGKAEQPVPPKSEPEKPDYKVGNCGKLFNTESEAYVEARRKFDDFSDPEKYVSSYMVYSTYDKWTISYTYVYY